MEDARGSSGVAPERAAALSLAAILALAPSASSQPGGQPPPDARRTNVEERAVVVARDVFVEPKARRLDDVTITVGGSSAPVVALAKPEDEPLHTLVVLDAALADTIDLRRAALVAAGLAGELTALGPVRLVVVRAGGVEERVGWTDDASRIEDSLSRLGLEGNSDEISSKLRLPWVAADVLEREPPGFEDSERAAREATLAIVRHVDRLVELAAEPQPSSRRLLLLARGGFDPCPAEFFGAGEVAPALTGCGNVVDREPGLALGPTLAALGWTVVALVPHDPEDPKAWRRFGMLDRPDESWLPAYGAVRKINQERKPARARLYLEQARVHLDADQLAAAEEDGHWALHHFANGRKTRAEQSEAWHLLAGVHALRGDASATARSLLRARRADLEAASSSRTARRLATSYEAARTLVERIAEDTGGAAVDVGADTDLATALSEIAARQRVTYQLPEAVAVEPLRLEVTVDGRPLEATSWTSPTPTRLESLALARRLLREGRGRDDALRPAFGVFFAAADADTDEDDLALYLELGTVAPDVRRWSTGPWRVTVLRSELDSEQHHVDAPERPPGSDRFELRVPLDRAGAPIALILVEDLATGTWGFAAP
jgi:hypothetical protein